MMIKIRTKKAVPFDLPIGGGVVVVCPLSASQMSSLRKKHTGMIVVGRDEKETFDSEGFTGELFDRILIEFKQGFCDEDNAPLVANEETKGNIYENDNGFAGLVLDKMNQAESARRLGTAGNLPPGQTGSSTPPALTAPSA